MNPIQVFFGTRVPAILRAHPGQLLRIAERVKVALMRVSHPDVTGGGHDESSIVSEAFASLRDATPEQIEEWVGEFLQDEKGLLDDFKRRLRESEEDRKQLEKSNSRLRREKKSLSKKLEGASNRPRQIHAWDWFVASTLDEPDGMKDAPENLPSGSIARAMLHHYRVIVEDREGYTSYEFDLMGRIRRRVESGDIVLARTAFLLRDRNPIPGVKLSERRGGVLIGSVDEVMVNKRLKDAIAEGIIPPYISVGRHPVFVYGSRHDSYNTASVHLKHVFPGVIREIILLKKARQALLGTETKTKTKEVIGCSNKSLRRRLAEYRKRKRRGR